MIRSVLKGCGSYLPSKVITNEELSKFVDTSDEWIASRTGIKQRYMAAEGEVTSDLAHHAAVRALDDAGMTPADIDLIIVGTTSPDRSLPATAAILQGKLGISHGAAFDLQAVCSSFLYGLAVADNFLKAGQHQNALVIGAETLTRLLDWEDRNTAVLFGDGAGAVVLAAEENPGSTDDAGILATYLRCDGRLNKLITSDGGISETRSTGFIRMEGREVFRNAVANIAEAIEVALAEVDLSIADVDWFVPHQANIRILNATAKRLGIPEEKVVVTIADHGNTSSASVPLAFDVAVKDGRIKKGDLVLFEAMGGGLTWGSALMRL